MLSALPVSHAGGWTRPAVSTWHTHEPASPAASPRDAEALSPSSQDTAQPVARFDCPCLLPFNCPVCLVRSASSVSKDKNVPERPSVFLLDSFGKCAGAVCRGFVLNVCFYTSRDSRCFSCWDAVLFLSRPAFPPPACVVKWNRAGEVLY